MPAWSKLEYVTKLSLLAAYRTRQIRCINTIAAFIPSFSFSPNLINGIINVELVLVYTYIQYSQRWVVPYVQTMQQYLVAFQRYCSCNTYYTIITYLFIDNHSCIAIFTEVHNRTHTISLLGIQSYTFHQQLLPLCKALCLLTLLQYYISYMPSTCDTGGSSARGGTRSGTHSQLYGATDTAIVGFMQNEIISHVRVKKLGHMKISSLHSWC